MGFISYSLYITLLCPHEGRNHTTRHFYFSQMLHRYETQILRRICLCDICVSYLCNICEKNIP